MKVHHLNCGTLCPVAASLVVGKARCLVCHCLLIETNEGLVLVDTGFGTQDIADPKRLMMQWIGMMGPKFEHKETAIEQVKALGFKPEDVRHIILTHLDFDHCSGISDFPNAKIHIYKKEYEIATATKKSYFTNHRYKPVHWAHKPHWEFYEKAEGEQWRGFDAVRSLRGVSEDILLIPLVGHTFGHCGIAVKNNNKWLLHAGDAYFFYKEMHEKPKASAILKVFQGVLAMDNQARLENQKRLRHLSNTQADVTVFSAHDAIEFNKISKE